MIKAERFNKAIKKIVEGYGAVSHPNLPNEWEINTLYGKLTISVSNPDKWKTLFNIFTRFEEPERAKGYTDCNPYSGKWNFHFTCDLENAVTFFTSCLEKVLPKYVITSIQTKYKTVREVYQCDCETSLQEMVQTLKESPKGYSSITISRREPQLIQKENHVTIFHNVSLC